MNRRMEFSKEKFSNEETGFGDSIIVDYLCLQPEKAVEKQTNKQNITQKYLVCGSTTYTRFG